MSITEDNASPNAEAIGIPIRAGRRERSAEPDGGSRPGATLSASGRNVIQPYHNQHVVPTTFTVADLGHNAVSSLGNTPIRSGSAATVPTGEAHLGT